jgi:DNA polymerase gamma 1
MLHAFITAMEYLIKEYNLNAKFCISIHDSITYLCEESQTESLGACFQIAHAWSWAWLRRNYGLVELPAGGTWFSSVEVDHVMRKSATTSVVTISNPLPQPNGVAYSPEELFPHFDLFCELAP